VAHGYFEILLAQECARAAVMRRPFAVLRVQANELAGAELVIDAITRALRDIDVLGSYGPDDHEVLLVEVEPSRRARSAIRSQPRSLRGAPRHASAWRAVRATAAIPSG